VVPIGMKLNVRYHSVIHFDVGNCDRPGIGMFGEYRCHVSLPVLILDWFRVVHFARQP